MSHFGTKLPNQLIESDWANEVEAGVRGYETTATALSAYTPTTTGINGVCVLVYSSHASDGGLAEFTYGNGAWAFAVLIESRPSRDVWVKPNSGADLLQTWNAYLGERKIKIPNGTYTIDDVLEVPATSGLNGWVVGHPSTVIRHIAGTLDKLIDGLPTDWSLGADNPTLRLQNLKLEINTKDANTICLDSEYLVTHLENVNARNTNGTKRGTGVKVSPASNSGGAIWNKVVVSDFGTNFYIRQDHYVINLPISTNPATRHFEIRQCYHTTIKNPQAFLSVANITTATRWYFNYCYDGIVLINPHAEKASNGEHIFQYETPNKRVHIYGFIASGGAENDPVMALADDPYLKIHGSDNYLTQEFFRQRIEAHVADDLLTKEESGSVHTNLGAGAAVTLTLPQDAIVGDYFEFAVMAAQALRIDPGAAGAIYINGAKQTDNKYIWADDEGESVKLVADGNGDWVAIGAVGTWTVE